MAKGSLISEGIMTLVPLPTKSVKSRPWAESLNKLFTEKCGKFKFSAQGRDLAPFVGNGTKVKMPSEIKPPLKKILLNHRELLFECALCTFANMYRRDLVWHLREHHRKEHGFSDGQLVKEFVHMPKDLRKIICIKCSETEAHENAVWLAVDPNEVCGELFNFKYF